MAFIDYKPPITVVNLGCDDDDLNWFLLHFIDGEVLSRLPLLDFQIDQLADRLNWDIISNRELSGWIFAKYKDKINWEVFIKNKKPKQIIYLNLVRDKLHEYSYLFLDHRIRKLYYNSDFISTY